MSLARLVCVGLTRGTYNIKFADAKGKVGTAQFRVVDGTDLEYEWADFCALHRFPADNILLVEKIAA